jgi:dTDP-4-amino-4,6-dideoxygalactose transaminase
MEIARRHNLIVIEDASQAHGAKYKGRPAGSIGDLACFSFYPGKNLGAYGEAGAITTNNKDYYDWMCRFRDHGQERKYHHSVIGWNARMDGIQGAVLSVKLRHLEKWTEARRAHAARYNRLLSDAFDVLVPEEAAHSRPVYHIYAIRTSRRDQLLAALKDRNVHCAIHYPVPIHLQEAYRSMGLGRGSFPVAERAADSILSLPMFAELTPAQIDRAAAEVRLLAAGSGDQARQAV